FRGMQELQDANDERILQGTVLKVTDTEVLVDIGQKSEGAIPLAEFQASDGSVSVSPGDRVDVQIESYDEGEGAFIVSHRKAAQFKAWDAVEQAFHDQTNISGRVVERTKGGLTVDAGVRAFLPGSQADVRPLRDLESLIGQEISCKVIDFNKSRNNVVVSRKAALEEDLSRKRDKLLEVLREGAVLPGRVKNVTDYGAFVDLGGLDGLLHITDLAWGRVSRASDLLEAGQEIQVKVLKYDAEKGRVSLGLKQLTTDPWERVTNIYQVGHRLTGRVVSVTDYGAFVEIEPGVEGLVHVSEMAWSRRLKHPSKILQAGNSVEIVILEIHRDQRRISLSLKQSRPDPWTTLHERYALGVTVEGRVRNLTEFGAFVEIEDGVDALIHVSDLSWSKNIKHPSEVLKKGQKVQGVILSLDGPKRRISMGLKQLQPGIWENFFSTVQAGYVIRGKVVRVAQFGAFVELQDGIEGLCHNSEIDEMHAADGPAPLKIGSECEFQVLRLDPVEKRIGLSLKALAQKLSCAEAGTGMQKEAPGRFRASDGTLLDAPAAPNG
ncbi:MAG: 30S ribosomal protein S1, partial [Terriglobia bacterium]